MQTGLLWWNGVAIFFINKKNGFTKTFSADANMIWNLSHSLSSKWQSASVPTVNLIEDAYSIWSSTIHWSGQTTAPLESSRHNFFYRNQHLKYQAFQKPVGNMASKSFPETSIEIASFCPDFNARDILNSERHLSASSRAESKLITSQSEFAIILLLLQERNVRITLKWLIWLVIDSWSLTAPIRNSVPGRTEFCKITMTWGRRNIHSSILVPLLIFDRRPPPWCQFLALPSLLMPWKSKMAVIVFVKKYWAHACQNYASSAN